MCEVRTDAEAEAADLLVHYMRVAGLYITGDVDAQLRKLVRLIVDAAIAQSKVPIRPLNLHQMLTKKELCMIIVNNQLAEGPVVGGRTASMNDLLRCSTLAVALEYLNLLPLKEMREYAAERSGVVFCGIVDVDSCKVKTLSFRELLSLLPEE